MTCVIKVKLRNAIEYEYTKKHLVLFFVFKLCIDI